MVDVPEHVLALAREIAKLARMQLVPEARVILFGSWAKGTAFPRSDLDVAVSIGARIPPTKLARLEMSLDGVRGLRKVDLVDLEAASADLRSDIVRDGIEL